MIVFVSGLPYHILLAILAHPIEYNMTWAATQKDVQETSLLDEVKEILSRYWHCYLVMFSFVAVMLLFGTNLLSQEFCIYGINLFWPSRCSDTSSIRTCSAQSSCASTSKITVIVTLFRTVTGFNVNCSSVSSSPSF